MLSIFLPLFLCRHLNLCKQFSCPHKETHDSTALSMRCYVIFFLVAAVFFLLWKKNPRHVSDLKKNRFHCCILRYGHGYVRECTNRLRSDYVRCAVAFFRSLRINHQGYMDFNFTAIEIVLLTEWEKFIACCVFRACAHLLKIFIIYLGFLKWSLSTFCKMNDRF